MSEDGMTWIKHDGGPSPVPGDTLVRHDYGDNPKWDGYGGSDVVATIPHWPDVKKYAIVTPSPSAVAPEPAIDAHYTKHAIEPMEYSMANKLDAMQHTVVKYVTRFRDKHGKRDLLAARHVLDMLIKREYPNG